MTRFTSSITLSKDHCCNTVVYHHTSYEEDLLRLSLSGCKKLTSCIKNKMDQIEQAKLHKRQTREVHSKRAAFLREVLSRLPFLYVGSKEMEDYQWVKLAYDLFRSGNLPPEAIRLQTGPDFFICYGSLVNQIKRAFFEILEENSPYVCPLSCSDNEAIACVTEKSLSDYKKRSTKCNHTYEYYTSTELAYTLKSGRSTHEDFFNTEIPTDCSQIEWFHVFGAVYQSNNDSIQALKMQVCNYNLEINFLEMLLQENSLDIPQNNNPGIVLRDFILSKLNLIRKKYLVEVTSTLNSKLDLLQKVRRGSDAYYHLLNY